MCLVFIQTSVSVAYPGAIYLLFNVTKNMTIAVIFQSSQIYQCYKLETVGISARRPIYYKNTELPTK